MVLVTHHVEEIPPGFTHVLLLREGGVVAAGPIDDDADRAEPVRHVRAAAGPRAAPRAAGLPGRAPAPYRTLEARVAGMDWLGDAPWLAGAGSASRSCSASPRWPASTWSSLMLALGALVAADRRAASAPGSRSQVIAAAVVVASAAARVRPTSRWSSGCARPASDPASASRRSSGSAGSSSSGSPGCERAGSSSGGEIWSARAVRRDLDHRAGQAPSRSCEIDGATAYVHPSTSSLTRTTS